MHESLKTLLNDASNLVRASQNEPTPENLESINQLFCSIRDQSGYESRYCVYLGDTSKKQLHVALAHATLKIAARVAAIITANEELSGGTFKYANDHDTVEALAHHMYRLQEELHRCDSVIRVLLPTEEKHHGTSKRV